MDNIFIKKETVISSFIAPWILGYGCKTPEEAKKYIKVGKTLSPTYYPANQERIRENGAEFVHSLFMDRLFNENNIDQGLTQIIGENVYKPWNCLSGIYQIEINERMGLLARPNGITQNNECVVIVDDSPAKFFRTNNEEELKIKLLATMAVWRANKGVYFIKKMNKKTYKT